MIGGWLFGLLVVAAVIAWWLRRRGTWSPSDTGGEDGFVVTFDDGEITATRGVVTRAVHAAFADVAAWRRLSGEVRCRGDRLSFSGDLDEPARQQLRNAWVLGRG